MIQGRPSLYHHFYVRFEEARIIGLPCLPPRLSLIPSLLADGISCSSCDVCSPPSTYEADRSIFDRARATVIKFATVARARPRGIRRQETIFVLNFRFFLEFLWEYYFQYLILKIRILFSLRTGIRYWLPSSLLEAGFSWVGVRVWLKLATDHQALHNIQLIIPVKGAQMGSIY